jgi:hypothetical protein
MASCASFCPVRLFFSPEGASGSARECRFPRGNLPRCERPR